MDEGFAGSGIKVFPDWKPNFGRAVKVAATTSQTGKGEQEAACATRSHIAKPSGGICGAEPPRPMKDGLFYYAFFVFEGEE